MLTASNIFIKHYNYNKLSEIEQEKTEMRNTQIKNNLNRS